MYIYHADFINYETELLWNTQILCFCMMCLYSFWNYSQTSGSKRFRLDLIMIVLLSAAQVEKDDSLPQSVCLTCLDSTAQFLAFRETCHQTQVTLKRQLSSPVSNLFYRPITAVVDKMVVRKTATSDHD